MNKKVLDPAGHLKLAVSDFTVSKQFYGDLFSRLGFKQIADYDQSVAWVTQAGFGIWIAQAKESTPAYAHFAPGIHHLCFKAASPQLADSIYHFLVSQHTHIFDEPHPYPEYTDKYYAVFFADPDGIKLEVAYY